MNIPHLHDWPTTPAGAIALQRELAPRVDVRSPLPGPPRLVAGCDISYDRGSPTVFAAVVVVELPGRAVVERAVVRAKTMFPYVPGLLSFREAPPVLEAFARLRSVPDAVMLDGQGVAHPRGFGLACHLGLWLGVPCLGCAKSRLVGTFADPGPAAGDSSPLVVGGKAVGDVLRTRAKVKPVFVSPGHKIDRAGAVAVVLAALDKYRLPVPTRAAHVLANEARAGGAVP